MHHVRKSIASLIAAAIALCLVPFTALAAYREKPVHMIVSFAPGGATDVVARALAARLGKIWNQQVIVENRSGAGGNIDADAVAKAAPDGYTLLLASAAEIAISPWLFTKMPNKPAVALLPVSNAWSANYFYNLCRSLRGCFLI